MTIFFLALHIHLVLSLKSLIPDCHSRQFTQNSVTHFHLSLKQKKPERFLSLHLKVIYPSLQQNKSVSLQKSLNH